jgi:hypothetical protein
VLDSTARWVGGALTAGGLGGLTAWLGKAGSLGKLKNALLAVAAPLFSLVVLLLVAAGTQAVMWRVFAGGPPLAGAVDALDFRWVPPFRGEAWQVLLSAGALLAVGMAMGWFVNVNRFSLQAMYRNRLVRAYLGATNQQRSPNLFTGFDPHDNLRLHELRTNRPWPVVNIALNLVGGEELAWQERKAESFTATPLHCGSARLGYRRSQVYGGENGISVGAAIATSGAAASPNMGHHSSPAVTFIMALFNARLGAWLGNPGPAGARTYTRGGPIQSARPLVDEALGRTDASHPYVYLSDGGHFENLALYEMVRRRCRLIVVCDVGCDPNWQYDDLGSAIRKVRIDLGIPIDFEPRIAIRPKPVDEPVEGSAYCALGTIRYSAVDGPDAQCGKVLYIKPTIIDQEPYDVTNYSRRSPDFPHEGTADQWFSESQFESYRALGKHVVATIVDEKRSLPGGLANLLAEAGTYLGIESTVDPAAGEPAAVDPRLYSGSGSGVGRTRGAK